MDTRLLGHHFYAYNQTEIAQCQGYAGLHLQLGALAMGLLPLDWKNRGGVSAYLGLWLPRGLKRRWLKSHLKLWPRGGPNGEIEKRRRALRSRDPNLGYAPPQTQQRNDLSKAGGE